MASLHKKLKLNKYSQTKDCFYIYNITSFFGGGGGVLFLKNGHFFGEKKKKKNF
jgi:hypothetical protein